MHHWWRRTSCHERIEKVFLCPPFPHRQSDRDYTSSSYTSPQSLLSGKWVQHKECIVKDLSRKCMARKPSTLNLMYFVLRRIMPQVPMLSAPDLVLLDRVKARALRSSPYSLCSALRAHYGPVQGEGVCQFQIRHDLPLKTGNKCLKLCPGDF